MDSAWRLNPDAHLAFQSLGKASTLLMFIVGTTCALAAVGMWRNSESGTRLAVVILSVNILGDLFNALVRHDLRALIGLPIGANDCLSDPQPKKAVRYQIRATRKRTIPLRAVLKNTAERTSPRPAAAAKT